MSISVDDTVWYVFTRDNIKNNSELDELGISYDAMYDILYDNEAYMDAILYYENGDFVELVVRKRSLDTGMANLSNYKNKEVLELAKEIAKKVSAETYSVYENKYKFARLEYIDSQHGCYVCEFITIVNKDNYTLTFQSPSQFTDYEYAEIEKIVDCITFNIDTSLKERRAIVDNVVELTYSGAVIGCVVGGIITIRNKKKKKSSETDDASVVDNAETD